ncbi:hypothetical protein L1987_54931 [Smallanthus sonchifolius]|uniref:Uncharacterized protein n=1 Tax=Smallanthus sonchifolius TaxID=185202 RepID=A0ACB9E8V6_9ASTR|nr:hypothetical protein L1987_54931 [Smallanthus sonchifolius]
MINSNRNKAQNGRSAAIATILAAREGIKDNSKPNGEIIIEQTNGILKMQEVHISRGGMGDERPPGDGRLPKEERPAGHEQQMEGEHNSLQQERWIPVGSKRRRQKAISFFLTNLPDFLSGKELWMECRNLGHIVDAFIPRKKDKLKGGEVVFLPWSARWHLNQQANLRIRAGVRGKRLKIKKRNLPASQEQILGESRSEACNRGDGDSVPDPNDGGGEGFDPLNRDQIGGSDSPEMESELGVEEIGG